MQSAPFVRNFSLAAESRLTQTRSVGRIVGDAADGRGRHAVATGRIISGDEVHRRTRRAMASREIILSIIACTTRR